MKRICFLLCAIACLLCQSCQNEEIEAIEQGQIQDFPGPSPVFTLLDGGEISDAGFYCLERSYTLGDGKHWEEYYSEVKTVSDYDSIYFYLMFHRGAPRYRTENEEEMSAIGKIQSELEKEKSMFIYESYKDATEQMTVGWPVLFTAYLNGDISITCGKTLFGEQPGTDLGKYFTVHAGADCIPVGVENPRILYDFGEEIPKEVRGLFVYGTWLQPKYVLNFLDKPGEKYEELTLHLSLPVVKEHVRDIAVSRYRGTDYGQKYSETTFDKDCTIRFEWK